MQTRQNFDIIICGAGPAGSTCALALGRSGLKVAIVEKNIFPRDKICGDAIAAYVPKVLNTIDPGLVTAFENFAEKEKVNTIRIAAPNGSFLDVKTKEFGYISPRLKFDEFLFKEVCKFEDVKVFQGSSLTDVVINEKGVTVTLDNNMILETQLIIGCDGAQGMVAKKLTSTKVDLDHNSAAVRTYYRNVGGLKPLTFELNFLEDILPGYFWIFPLPNDQCNVGLGIPSKMISDKKINLKERMMRIISEAPQIKERFKNAQMIGEVKGFGLPLGSRKVQMSGDRFMLCGDAASLIDPVTGEGIGPAMLSGRYAGWHALACFKKNDFSAAFMKEYDNLVYAKLWKNYKRRNFIKELIDGRPGTLNSIVRIANKSNFVKSTIENILW